jgi:hypothetical protein
LQVAPQRLSVPLTVPPATGSCLPVLPPYWLLPTRVASLLHSTRLAFHYFYFPPAPPFTIVLGPPTSRASTPCTFLASPSPKIPYQIGIGLSSWHRHSFYAPLPVNPRHVVKKNHFLSDFILGKKKNSHTRLYPTHSTFTVNTSDCALIYCRDP